MKYFCLIFSLYLLMLSVMPCSDNDECNQSDKVEQASNNEQDEHEESEYCSPFCICSCCNFSAFQLQLPSFVLKVKVAFSDSTKGIIPYSLFYNKEISSKCWQPPKLS